MHNVRKSIEETQRDLDAAQAKAQVAKTAAENAALAETVKRVNAKLSIAEREDRVGGGGGGGGGGKSDAFQGVVRAAVKLRENISTATIEGRSPNPQLANQFRQEMIVIARLLPQLVPSELQQQPNAQPSVDAIVEDFAPLRERLRACEPQSKDETDKLLQAIESLRSLVKAAADAL